MLRIHFTGEDLARTTLAEHPDPLWEVSISLHRLQRRDSGVLFAPWRRDVLRRLPTAATRMLSPVAPAKGYCLDFLTPAPSGGSLAAGLDLLRSTERSAIRRDLQEFHRQHPGRRLPAWCAHLADGTETLGRLTDAVKTYFDACLAPHWQRIGKEIRQDRARRSALLARGGWEAVFTSLHPTARWNPPVLELDYPDDRDVHLEGRGLVLQPSFFCRYQATSVVAQDMAPVLVHPIDHDPGWASGGAPTALPALLGPVRARLLQESAHGPATTGELARRTGTTAPNASRHLGALREAGLIHSSRRRNAVLHATTALGTALLNGATPRVPA
ncbi:MULTISPECIES: winged helix-turn-helix domain-containing protein [Streptomyces]